VLAQHAADRLDPEAASMLVDEGDYLGSRGSSSRAKKADAARLSHGRSPRASCGVWVVVCSWRAGR
jgi:hypothetical protein